MNTAKFDLSRPLSPCAPPFWANTGHLQTVLGHLLPSPTFVDPGETIELNVPGGDIAVSHLHHGTSDTVVYLFHGLGGFSHASYMQRTALIAERLGHTVFMFNHRGCGAGAGKAREPYHSGRAEDLSAMIDYGRKLFPHKVHLAIGFSLSANALLLLAAGQRATVLPDLAIAVNAPINLGRAAKLLQQGFSRVYDLRFMIDMRKALRSRFHHDNALKEISLNLFSTLTEFDDLYTAPFGGFKSREHYYATCSAAQYLKDIKIPTVILTASDDPFVDVEDYEAAKLSSQCHLHVEKHGGHMGYLSKKTSLIPDRRWLDYALETYMKAIRY